MKNRTKLPNIYLGIIMTLMYLPIVLIVIYSFNESKLTSVWGGFSLKWYEQLFKDREMMEAIKNSIILAFSSCILSAIIGTIGAVGLARMNFKTKGMIEYLSNIPIMIPEIILGMVFLAFFSFINLPKGMLTLIIAHTTFCIPYILMMVKARLVGIDKSLAEAAKDLGASEIRAFFDITLPLIMPAVLSGSLLAFAMSLDDVVISIFFFFLKVTTLPIKIYTQMKFGVTPEINALCAIMLVVTIGLILVSTRIGRKKI